MILLFLTFYFLVSLGFAAEELGAEKQIGHALFVFICWPIGVAHYFAQVIRDYDDKH